MTVSHTSSDREVILSVFSPISMIQDVLTAGETPIFADHDPSLGVLTARSVEDQVSLFTKAVIAAPVAGAMPDPKLLARVTSPRGIELRVVSESAPASPRELAPGLKVIGSELVLVDENLIAEGRLALQAELASLGISSEVFQPGFGFEQNLAPRRGRRRDYPGAQMLADRGLILHGADLQDAQTAARIVEAARRCARQASFSFMLEPAPPIPQRRPPAAQLLASQQRAARVV